VVIMFTVKRCMLRNEVKIIRFEDGRSGQLDKNGVRVRPHPISVTSTSPNCERRVSASRHSHGHHLLYKHATKRPSRTYLLIPTAQPWSLQLTTSPSRSSKTTASSRSSAQSTLPSRRSLHAHIDYSALRPVTSCTSILPGTQNLTVVVV
jgi:hypothetical protein